MKYNFKNKNVLVVGLKKSGLASLSFLEKKGAFCYAYDSNPEVSKQVCCEGTVSVVSNIEEDLIKMMDYMVISPSVSIFSECVKLAKLYGVKVIGELELGSCFAKGKLIAVSGTNGKTTVCSMIYDVLQSSKKRTVLCGNIGEPLTEKLLPFSANYVVETSSFQLESTEKFSPDIAVLTNITPNHLDRHLTFKNYRDAKFKIFENMSSKKTLILNYDDKVLREIKNQKVKPKIIWVSAEKEVDGYFLRDTKIYKKKGKKIDFILDLSGIKLVGKHNMLNALLVTAVAKTLKLKNSDIYSALMDFEPVCHRLQFVSQVNGVGYVNDSKSTSPQSTITAINSFEKSPLILILGGSDKQTNFDLLALKIKKTKNIKLVVVQGQTTKKIVKSLKKYNVKHFKTADNFDQALQMSTQNSQTGDIVLLSPACASFDAFKSFEARGEKFVEYVKGLNVEKEK